jgi:3-hydroxyisobutyrate dehydrogenase-like beta-hydroxyacid dehydrogenase
MKQLETISATTDKTRIGLLGLGLMGTAICERLIAHGYDVHVWNRTRAKAEPLIAIGAHWSDNPLAACERVIISLYSSDVVAEVIEQLQSGLRPGSILIDTTTGDAEACVAMANRLAAQGVMYLDAPISGSSDQTRKGEATVMASGEPTAIEACADLWPVLGQRVFTVGASGSAARIKLISNLVLGLNRVALAEGLAFAEAIGVDPGAALEVLKASAAYSRVMDVKGRKMLDADFKPQAKLSQHLKDVRLILRAASATGLALPLSQTHCELLEQAESAGCGELDNCSIISLYQRPGNR